MNSNNNVVDSSTEKYFKTRRADIFFKLSDGKKIVIEIQHSKITTKEISDRTHEYNQQGMFVLWILHGKGNSVASPKFPEHKKDVKVSPVEKLLHKMYGGRVYYVNVNEYFHKTTITFPFAIHYSLSDKKPKKSFRKNYEYFYYRNSNFAMIYSWKLLCVDYNEFKIARFYDKNIKISLKNQIFNFIQDSIKKYPLNYEKKSKTKKLVNKIFKEFRGQYGKAIIMEAIYLLNDKIQINEKYINKIKNHYR